MDQVKDVLEHVDYLYSLDSADHELYQVSFVWQAALSLLFVRDLNIRYFY
jgi:hypothetical protein